MERKNGKLHADLMDACNEYPPSMEKIKGLLSQIEDISELYTMYGMAEDADYTDMHHDFLSSFIENYLQKINKDWFGYYVYNDEIKDLQYVKPLDPRPELHHETYATDIVRLFLEYGYDMNALNGTVGTACLNALVLSDFNDEMMRIAEVLLNAGADPDLKNSEGDTVLDLIDLHRTGTDWSFDDDYLDNRDALYKFYDLCQKQSLLNRAIKNKRMEEERK